MTFNVRRARLLLGMALLLAVVPSRVVSVVLTDAGTLHLNRAAGLPPDPGATRYERALVLGARAIDADPANSRALSVIGLAQAARGNDEAAVAALERAVAADARNRTAHYRLAEILHRRGDVAGALRHWRAADAAPSLVRRGLATMQAGRPVQAQQDFELATAIDPDNYEAWLELGAASAELDRLDEARTTYEEAIRRHPEQSEAYRRLAGLYYLRVKDLATAAAIVEQGIAAARHPGDGLYAIRSRLEALRHDYAAAERDARTAIELSPRNGAHLTWLADLYADQNRHAEAVAQYLEAARLARGTEWAWMARERAGRVYAGQEAWDKAVAEYRAAVAIVTAQGTAPETVAAIHVALGDALLHAGRRTEAQSAYQEALTLDPRNAAAAANLASVVTGAQK